ncbi:MAG: glycosyltransferase family 4 protein [Rhodanobacter sp.]|jgi:glycosyltransferase involved in cell wall biosynthesis
MKIVMFTPVLKASAIGRMARLVTCELMRLGHDVLVVRSEEGDLLSQEAHDFGLAPIAWNDHAAVTTATAKADLIIYQVGDNTSFHRGCLEWLPHCPGIVCLHDFYLGHLFNGWAAHHRAEAELILRHWYGSSVAESFFELATSAMFMERTWEAAPMTEWICAMATAVITHSSWGIGRLQRACAGPVRVVPLAYDRGSVDIGQERHGGDDGEGMLNILTVGYVNANKRAASVIRAIGSSHLLRDRVVYRLAGPIKNTIVHELAALARNCKVRLRVMGEVDEAELSRAFQQADIVCCLRWPSLEAASASAIEAMLYGKAIVVTDTGFYRELPNAFVTKVVAEDEAATLRSALERLGTDRALRNVLGELSRDWAAETFTAQNYVEEIVSMANTSARIRPVLEATAYFRRVMASWGNVDVGIDPASDPRAMFLNIASADGAGPAA